MDILVGRWIGDRIVRRSDRWVGWSGETKSRLDRWVWVRAVLCEKGEGEENRRGSETRHSRETLCPTPLIANGAGKRARGEEWGMELDGLGKCNWEGRVVKGKAWGGLRRGTFAEEGFKGRDGRGAGGGSLAMR